MFIFSLLLIMALSVFPTTLSLAPPLFGDFESVHDMRRRLNIDYPYSPKHFGDEKCRYLTPQACQDRDEHVGRQRAERRLNPSIGDGLRVIVLLIRFSDHTNRDLPSREFFEDFFNGEGREYGSVKEWLRFNSVGRYRVHFDVRDWATLPNTEKFYAAGNSGWTTDFNPIVAPLLTQIDNDPNHKWFSGYIDEFGKLNHLVVVHSGYMAEVGEFIEACNRFSDKIF